MSQKCINNPDNFCYICGEVTFASRKCSFTPTIKKAYFLDFGSKDKKWAPHMCCTACSSKLNAWVNGKGCCMLLGVPMVWKVPSNHSTDCYFCMVPPIQNGMSMKKNQHQCIQIYHQQFGLCLMAKDFLFLNLRTILLYTLTTMTVFLQTAKNSSHQLQEM